MGVPVIIHSSMEYVRIREINHPWIKKNGYHPSFVTISFADPEDTWIIKVVHLPPTTEVKENGKGQLAQLKEKLSRAKRRAIVWSREIRRFPEIYP